MSARKGTPNSVATEIPMPLSLPRDYISLSPDDYGKFDLDYDDYRDAGYAFSNLYKRLKNLDVFYSAHNLREMLKNLKDPNHWGLEMSDSLLSSFNKATKAYEEFAFSARLMGEDSDDLINRFLRMIEDPRLDYQSEARVFRKCTGIYETIRREMEREGHL